MFQVSFNNPGGDQIVPGEGAKPPKNVGLSGTILSPPPRLNPEYASACCFQL